MSQTTTRGIANNAVTDLKVRLRNNNSLRARNNADSADVSLLKLDAADVLQFMVHPQISTSASGANDVATYKDITAAIEGMKPKETVVVATTANISLTGEQTIDGVLTSGSRVLVKDQSTSSENGIYVTAAGAWSRAADASTASELTRAYVPVALGTANAGKFYVESLVVTTLGTDPVTFVYFNSVANLVGGDGITVTGNTIDVDHDGQGLTFVANQLALELDGSTLAKGASGLKVATGGITENELASSVDADSFVLSAGYVAAAGTVTIGDTVEQAIEKIVGNIAALVTYAPGRDKFTLNGTDITNQYVDLAQEAVPASVQVSVVGLAPQFEGIDYTLSVVLGVTRITFAGDLATAGNAALISGDIMHVNYSY
jgi:hypothetical protein